MALSPLAVMLLAQLGLVMLAIIFFQKLQKRRLIKEIDSLKSPSRPFFAAENEAEAPSFDQDQVELLMNRIFQKSQLIISEVPASKALSLEQQELLHSLGEILGIQLDSSKAEPSINPASIENEDIITQQEIDSTLGREEALEEFEMDDFENLETSDTATDADSDLTEEEYELPEDSVQVALDNMGDFDMDEFESELSKLDD
ncbi:hypothetical protein [Marinospirillum insulare]|uniref:Uncharacterized protein n=1 Tax=Marinospirillum insulare TaxID=217169 RepID=A0ABQ5ZVC8_9GAMM|nr:hypothetical protein [Marinospirillum insulare]GLR62626.1 hypothetical protein GCM10007878_00610 [Marinospirillum insulare]